MQVSVVIASRNPSPKALKEVMDSVYGQTYRDFELIIVDDGSDVPVCDIAKPFVSDSIRTRFYRIEPSGLGAALNYGIAQADGEYIARIDDDDTMLPMRLQKQVEFLDVHPDVSCVGTWFYDRVRDKYYPHRQYPTAHNEIIKDLLSLRWGLAHTAVMYRKSAFDKVGGYRIPGGGQDLDLFLQLGSVGHLANVNEYLTCYTMSANGLGTVNPKKKEAYLFALSDVLEKGLYPSCLNYVNVSIRHLKEEKGSILRTKIIRCIMVWRIRLFGKKLDRNIGTKQTDKS